MTYINPFKSFSDEALVNLYGMLYSQNLANKEWFKSHNPLAGDIEMHDVTTSMLDHDKYVQDLEGHGRPREDVDGHSAIGVIGKESAPALRWRRSVPFHVPRDRRL